MEEGDAAAAGTDPRHIVDETKARRPAALQRAVQIRHAVADMMNARPAPGEKLRDRAARIAGLEQLDLDVAQGFGDDRRTVYGLGLSGLEAVIVSFKAEGGDEGSLGVADVCEQ